MRLWITAVLTMAATALMVGLTVTAQAGVHQAHPNPPLAGDETGDKIGTIVDTNDPAAFDALLPG
jgi:hypothetical protein